MAPSPGPGPRARALGGLSGEALQGLARGAPEAFKPREAPRALGALGRGCPGARGAEGWEEGEGGPMRPKLPGRATLAPGGRGRGLLRAHLGARLSNATR